MQIDSNIKEYANHLRVLNEGLGKIRSKINCETMSDIDYLSVSSFELSFLHCHVISSMVIVDNNNLFYSSLFALLRPAIETSLRGWWWATEANQDNATNFMLHDNVQWPKLKPMSQALNLHEPFKSGTYNNIYDSIMQNEWNIYHSFTHGGQKAINISQETDPQKIEPQLKIALKNTRTVMLINMVGHLFVAAKYSSKSDDKKLTDEFKTLLLKTDEIII